MLHFDSGRFNKNQETEPDRLVAPTRSVIWFSDTEMFRYIRYVAGLGGIRNFGRLPRRNSLGGQERSEPKPPPPRLSSPPIPLSFSPYLSPSRLKNCGRASTENTSVTSSVGGGGGGGCFIPSNGRADSISSRIGTALSSVSNRFPPFFRVFVGNIRRLGGNRA